MKTRHLLALLPALSLATAQEQDEVEESLPVFDMHFAGGDVIAGTPTAGNWENFTLSSSKFEGGITVQGDRLLSWQASSPVKREGSDHVARLVFNNGDSLKGAIANVDDENVTLRTDYAGELVIPRIFINSLEVGDGGNLLFQGPGPVNSWHVEPTRSWSLRDGTWRCIQNGHLARNVDLPDKFSLSFSGTWRHNLRLKVHLGEGEGDARRRNQYVLNLDAGRFSVQRRSARNGRGRMQPLDFNRQKLMELASLEEASFEVLVDRQEGAIHILQNDFLIGTWRDDAEAMADVIVDRIGFYSDDSNRMRLEDITVKEWSGTLPVQESVDEDLLELTESEKDKGYRLMPLANGDTVIGKILKIRDNAVEVETEFTNFAIPIGRLLSLPLGTRDDQAIRRRGDVRAYFANQQNFVTVRLDSINGFQAKVVSDNFGETTVDLRYFSRLEFWPHSPEMDRARELVLQQSADR